MHLSKKDNKLLSPIVKRLSRKYVNGDVFPPHISVSSYAQIELDEAISASIKCIEGMKKFEVEKDRLAKKLKVSEKYLVTSIAVVTSENKNDPRDYGSWKVVFEKDLEQ